MVNRFVTAAFAVLTALVSFDCLAADPVVEFERLIQRASTETAGKSFVYQSPKTLKWHARNRVISDLKYDVKKTDSLVTPAFGEVSFTLSGGPGRAFDTREEAEAAPIQAASGMVIIQQVKLRYGWRGEAWEFKDGSGIIWVAGLGVSPDLPKAPMTVSLASISSPDSALRPWLP